MLLRDYRTEDLPRIHVINEDAVPAVGTCSVEALGRIADQSVIALVAEDPDDGAIAGFCLVLPPGAEYGSVNYRWFADRYDDFVYLDRVAIASDHRRRGLGHLLYDEVERLTARRRPSATDLLLEVNLRPRNDPSLAFHAGLGFAEVGRQETPYGALVSLMSKSLTA